MSKRLYVQTAGVAAIVLALVGFAARIQAVREQHYPLASSRQALDIVSPTVLRHMAVGYSALAADLYWIRTIQYYGGTKLRLAAGPQNALPGEEDSHYELLYPLLDLTTTLDPWFNIAYRFGAIYLAEHFPVGADRPDLAQALLEKGLRERPDKWEYMQDIGFVHYWWRHDYKEAAEWFEKASNVPGAPWWLRSLAATTLATGGDRRSSRVMWEAIRESAELDWQRRDAERRLLQLAALDQIDDLQKRVDAYMARTGQTPATWEPLVGARVLPGVPVDPGGAPYAMEDGRVRLGPGSPLFPLPDDPKGVAAPPS